MTDDQSPLMKITNEVQLSVFVSVAKRLARRLVCRQVVTDSVNLQHVKKL